MKLHYFNQIIVNNKNKTNHLKSCLFASFRDEWHKVILCTSWPLQCDKICQTTINLHHPCSCDKISFATCRMTFLISMFWFTKWHTCTIISVFQYRWLCSWRNINDDDEEEEEEDDDDEDDDDEMTTTTMVRMAGMIVLHMAWWIGVLNSFDVAV